MNTFKCFIVALQIVFCTSALYAQQSDTFSNPLLDSGADPWVIYKDGFYFYTHTRGDRLTLWKTRSVTSLREAESKDVWKPPSTGPNSKSIWAPELHHLDGKWYIYYTATDVNNDGDASRFVFVLENGSKDPLQGVWTDKGKVNTTYSGLDGSILEHKDKRYFLYSAYVGPQSVLVICEMVNPWTLSNKQNVIAVPDFDWEKKGGRQILEGPQFLEGPTEKIFIVYSASACWADEYALGLLTANTKADLMDPISWTKSAAPVFQMSSENSVYAPGHNSFFKSPNGKEDWILYHATSLPDQKCKNRSPRAQRFSWKKDGTPDFGLPDSAGVQFKNPSK